MNGSLESKDDATVTENFAWKNAILITPDPSLISPIKQVGRMPTRTVGSRFVDGNQVSGFPDSFTLMDILNVGPDRIGEVSTACSITGAVLRMPHPLV